MQKLQCSQNARLEEPKPPVNQIASPVFPSPWQNLNSLSRTPRWEHLKTIIYPENTPWRPEKILSILSTMANNLSQIQSYCVNWQWLLCKAHLRQGENLASNWWVFFLDTGLPSELQNLCPLWSHQTSGTHELKINKWLKVHLVEPVVSERGYRGNILTVIKCCTKTKVLNSHPSHTGGIQELLKFKTIIGSEEISDGSK